MTEAPTNVIPETLLKQLQAMEDTDAKAKVAEIRLFLDDFSKLTSYLRKAPERVTYFEMVSITPETTTRLFGDPLMGLGYALESVSVDLH